MARQDYWTMPMEDLAQIVGKGGWTDSHNEATSKAAGRVLQARAVLDASKANKRLVWATWALVVMTLVVAVVTAA